MSSTDKLSDSRQELVDKIIADLEKGELTWRKCWGLQDPVNAISEKPYQGVNYLKLSVATVGKGYKDNRWLTFNQVVDKGYSFKKGEDGASLAKGKGERVEYTSFYDKLTKKEPDFRKLREELSQEELAKYFSENISKVRKTYIVFNGDLIDGLPEKKPFNMVERNERAEAMLERWSERECSITHDGANKAYYDIWDDTIHLPQRDSFFDGDSYYATAFHEVAHSTGSTSRLNRELEGFRDNKEKYSKEELVAELSSVFMSQHLELNSSSVETLENHSAYISSWLSQMRKNPNVLFEAVQLANKATNYILDNTQEQVLDKVSEEEKAVFQVLKPEAKPKENKTKKPAVKEPTKSYIDDQRDRRLDKTIEALPDEIKKNGEFVVFKLFQNKKGELKPTFYSPKNGKVAKSDKLEDCTTFDEAITYAKNHKCSGVALRLNGENGIACLDLDKAQGGLSSRIGDELKDKFQGTYTEKGNKGVRVFFTCDKDLKLKVFSKLTDVEFYQRLQFIPLTGESVSEKALKNFKEDSEAVKTIQKYFEPLALKTDKLTSGKDIRMLEEAFASPRGQELAQLMQGETLYADRERSDLALASYLTFATNGDKQAAERLFAASGRQITDKTIFDIAVEKYQQSQPTPAPKGKGKGNDKKQSHQYSKTK